MYLPLIKWKEVVYEQRRQLCLSNELKTEHQNKKQCLDKCVYEFKDIGEILYSV